MLMLRIYARHIGIKLNLDGNQWCATKVDFKNLHQSPAGFGDSCLEAMAALAKSLGYRPSKMWGVTFADLVKVAVTPHTEQQA